MPKRTDIHRILLIGSGPIVIGQGAEFDYSGTQAAKALREEGFEVILVNSNPATIMTDPEFADRTYIEPVTAEYVELVIAKERPDGLLPTMGGQTALNVAMKLAEQGVLQKYGVELIGADARAIAMAEDRKLFGEAMKRIGLAVPQGGIATTLEEAFEILETTAYPAIIRPAFTLGGTGGGIAYNRKEFEETVRRGLDLSPVTQVLVERSVIGWKEFELASKATGFPIARIGTKLAVGYRLDEIPNDITGTTPASFEPVLDYVVVKCPRFAFEKFRAANPRLTTQMKSVGESMAIGRTFKEAFQKALRALETGRPGWTTASTLVDDRLDDDSTETLRAALRQPTPERIFQVKRAFQAGLEV